MNLSQVPWTIVTFIIAQLGGFIFFLFRLNTRTERNEIAITALEAKFKAEMAELKSENTKLTSEIREVRETLILVKHSVDLLVLGQLKTGKNKEAA